jgi:hypothetical protein
VTKEPLRNDRVGAGLLALTLLAGVAVWPALLYADTYTDTGSPLGQDPSDMTPITGLTNVSGYFTIPGALGGGLVADDITSAITSFSFGDGLQTISSASSLTAEDFVVNTNATGAITDWAIDLATTGGSILSCRDVPQVNPYPPGSPSYGGDCEIGTGFGGTGDEVQTQGEIGIVVPGHGTWSVPEPSSSPLWGAGVVGLIGMALLRKRSRWA